jgi:hypothetical protein
MAPLLAGGGYSAKTNYILHCQGCHGADGIGGLPEKIPPLRDSMGHFLKVPGGRRFLIQVPGVAHAPVSDAEIAALLNFTLEQYSADQLPSPFLPYTEEEVARARREPTDIVVLRSELASMLLERFGVPIWTTADPIVPKQTDGDDVARH